MTVVVSIQVSEGLVLAADSATTVGVIGLEGSPVALKVWPHAKKLFHIKDYPVGALSWGLGSIGDRNMPSLIYEFEYEKLLPREQNKDYEVMRIANDLLEFLKDRYLQQYGTESNAPDFGMMISGYSDGEFFPEQYFFQFPQIWSLRNARPLDSQGRSKPGAAWFGLTYPLIRLIKGFDPRLRENLVKEGMSIDKVNEILNRFELPVFYETMPLQDAIDMAIWLVEAAIGSY